MNELLNRTTLMSKEEVASVLGVKPGTVKQWAYRGYLPSVKVGVGERGKLMFHPKDVFKFISDRTRPASPPTIAK